MAPLAGPSEAFAWVLERLRAGIGGATTTYLVPRCVLEPSWSVELVDVGDPYRFFYNLLAQFGRSQPPQNETGLREQDVVYLTFMRTFAALNDESGSALKQIAFVPFLRRLGVTVLLSLPTGRIGTANRKGTSGSPFAVTNPFITDPSLGDPLLFGLDPTVQYQALVHACRLAGMRCGSIVPAATLAIDSPVIARFPEVTYWWRQPPGTPLTAQLAERRPDSAAPDVVGPLDPALAAAFVPPPTAAEVTPTLEPVPGLWTTDDGRTPATACPDVAGDMSASYSWSDVASLRFDRDAVPDPGRRASEATAESSSLAAAFTSLHIAWRASHLGETVFWVDVAARVPPGVLHDAERLYASWDDSLSVLGTAIAAPGPPNDSLAQTLRARIASAPVGPPGAQLTFIAEELFTFSVAEAVYSAVVGPWVFCVAPFAHDLPTLARSARHHLDRLVDQPPAKPFLAGLGNHDTLPPPRDRAGGLMVATMLLARGIPFLFSGLEHGAEMIINKEFGFNTTAELLALRETLSDDVLPLFNAMPLDWRAFGNVGAGEIIARVRDLRAAISGLDMADMARASGLDDFLAYWRTTPTDDPDLRLLVVCNTSASRRTLAPPAGLDLLMLVGGRRRATGVELDACGAAVFGSDRVVERAGGAA